MPRCTVGMSSTANSVDVFLAHKKIGSDITTYRESNHWIIVLNSYEVINTLLNENAIRYSNKPLGDFAVKFVI